jgi:hypothetical protein
LTRGQDFFQTRRRYADLNQAEDLFPRWVLCLLWTLAMSESNPAGTERKHHELTDSANTDDASIFRLVGTDLCRARITHDGFGRY